MRLHGKKLTYHTRSACTATLEPRAEKLAAHALSFGLSIAAITFSPDGSMIASAGVDGSIKVWSAGVCRERRDVWLGGGASLYYHYYLQRA